MSFSDPKPFLMDGVAGSPGPFHEIDGQRKDMKRCFVMSWSITMESEELSSRD